MTDQARLRLHGATRRSRARSLLAVATSALLCGALLWLSSDQRNVAEHNLEMLATLRTARADLARGALDIALAAPGGQSDAAQGYARIAQAVEGIERAERSLPAAAGHAESLADVHRQMAALKTGLGAGASPERGAPTALMTAVAAVDRHGASLDTRMRAHFVEVTSRADLTFRVALVTALVLLLSMAAVIIAAERGLMAIFRDWREADREIMAIFDAMPALVWFKDRDHRLRRVNAPAARLSGHASDDVEGRPAREVLAVETAESEAADRAILDSGVARIGALESWPMPAGQRRWYRIDRVPYLASEGGVDGLLVVARDVTDAKKTDDALLDERNRLTALAEAAPTVLCSFRQAPDGSVSFPYASPKIEEIYGLTPAALADDAAAIAMMWHPDDRQRVLAAIEISRQQMTPWREEFRVRHPDKGEIWIEGHSVPFRDADGGVTWHGAITDVTERRRVQQELEAREELLAQTGEIAQIGGWELDPVTGRGRWTAEVARIHDVDPALPPSLELGLQFYPGEARTRVQRAVEGALAGIPYDIEVPFVSARGVPKWVRTIGRPVVRDGEVTLLRGAIHDITDRKRAEGVVQERLALEQRLSMLAAMSPAVMYSFHLAPDGRMTFPYASARFAELFGVPADELERDASAALSRIHPEDLPRVLQSIRRSAEEGTPWVEELRFSHPDGGTIWIEGRSTPTRQDDGSTVWYGTLLDVTDRHRLEAELRQAQKMEAIGRLAGGVAHDFNNLLTVILGNATQLLDETPGQDEVREIVKASERAANLTKQLLLFSRKQVMQPKHLDLNAVLSDLSRMLQRILGEDITLRAEFSGGLPAIHADQGMMEQVLLNLAVNSRDAMPHGGELHIVTRLSRAGSDEAQRPADLVDADYVRMSVRDTGSGIPPDTLGRIFEPFFTTKEAGKGTGLGLATVYGIVKQHGGSVAVESAPGQGATFHVYLPLAHRPAAVTTSRPVETPAGGAECLLVVEDERAVRDLAVRMLKQHGYRVLAAKSGVEALEVWQAHRAEISLLITDVVMPGGLTGLDLATRLSAERPELRVVFTSGYSRETSSSAVSLVPGIDFLEKPYHVRQLLSIVRRRLDAPPAVPAGLVSSPPPETPFAAS